MLGFFCADACVFTATVATTETNRPSQIFLKALMFILSATGTRKRASAAFASRRLKLKCRLYDSQVRGALIWINRGSPQRM